MDVDEVRRNIFRIVFTIDNTIPITTISKRKIISSMRKGKAIVLSKGVKSFLLYKILKNNVNKNPENACFSVSCSI